MKVSPFLIQYIRVCIFFVLMASVYVLAAAFLWMRWRNRSAGRSPLRPREWIVYPLAILGLLCIAYGYEIEPYWPEVTHVHLTNAKLRPGTHLRIVQFSDLHSDGTLRLEKRLPGIIREQHPDLIVFAGDTVNNLEGIPLAKEVFSRLSEIAPTYVVPGNWDVAVNRLWEQDVEHPAYFEGTGVHMLRAKAETLELAGNKIWLAGAAYGDDKRLPGLLRQAPPDEMSILIFHVPDAVDAARENKIDLYLAGHTHGGQIALPFYGALVTLSRYDKKYERGLHDLGGYWIYVTRGVGVDGIPPRARFCSRPEITVLDVDSSR